jgi:hypothetical protein
MWLYDNGLKEGPLKEYIKENMEVLKKERGDKR